MGKALLLFAFFGLFTGVPWQLLLGAAVLGVLAEGVPLLGILFGAISGASS
ncbi:MAG: hypothetical protein KDH20_02045 [Rhodocyclaceae bacterium]|nr:hypothetical protein [Gammaproteobacteria bacterium]MCB1886364.1 hypothetical protein [Rhodocyclaceae bacterium]